MIFPRRFLVAGTDTGIGKTLISAILTLGLNGHYYKPFQSGAGEGSDRSWVQRNTGLPDSHFSQDGISLKAPLSPDQAAAKEGIEIDAKAIGLPEVVQNHLIVEGAGGLMVPINDKTLLIDWVKRHQLPVVLVARSGLGTINHTLLSVRELQRQGIDLLGVVLNGAINQANKESIQRHSEVSILAEIDQMDHINAQTISAQFQRFKACT